MFIQAQGRLQRGLEGMPEGGLQGIVVVILVVVVLPWY